MLKRLIGLFPGSWGPLFSTQEKTHRQSLGHLCKGKSVGGKAWRERIKVVREGTFFLGGGRAGEFWYFFPKKVLTLPCVLIKKLLTPHL